MKPSRNPRLVVFNQVFTETSKSSSIVVNGLAIRPGRRRSLVLFDESRFVLFDEHGVGRVGIQDSAAHHWHSARRLSETTQCHSHSRGATTALVLLEIFIQRLLVKPSSKSRLVIFKEPTTKAVKRIYMALDRVLLGLTRVE
ncbi:hypothetical protein X741_32510 [Mesorhizobium sp. LNHC229A00]|nr:hypothetical protein X741_32510 [Mesorhizobium sp. LNHC229A00]